MTRPMPQHGDANEALSFILARTGKDVVMAAPLGLGKPNALINAIYAVTRDDATLSLMIFTALSLARPTPKPGLEARFLQPFLDRHFGVNYPDLLYVQDRAAKQLPSNVRIIEFYLQSGIWLNNADAQTDYASINYTHVARDVAAHTPNLIVQLVAQRIKPDGQAELSLSCNPDVSLDLLDEMARLGKPRPVVVFVVHPDLPFIGNEAIVDASVADFVLTLDTPAHTLFALPREPVLPLEHAIGMHASAWVKDGGTLQIGIGALSDAIVNALIWRHQDPVAWQTQVQKLSATSVCGIERGGFDLGLYGASEMVMDGFMHLRRAGILKRRVYDDLGLQRLLNQKCIDEVADASTLDRLIEAEIIPLNLHRPALQFLQHWGWVDAHVILRDGQLIWLDGSMSSADLHDTPARARLAAHMCGRHLRGGHYLHGGFWLGSKALIDWFGKLEGADFDGLSMTRISHINQLYGGREALEIEQRHHARFFNTCMMHTLLGAAISDGLSNGQVVSGVGGQYNFVAMAHAIPNGRSALLLRSTRETAQGLQSNLVWNYGHTTIPRHLRDLVITEYGVADVRGQCDQEVIIRLLAISDARCQAQLIAEAKRDGKLDADFVAPESWRLNTPEHLRERMQPILQANRANVFPFGADFTDDELKLARALKLLKARTQNKFDQLKLLATTLFQAPPNQTQQTLLARMELDNPASRQEKIWAKLLTWALRQA